MGSTSRQISAQVQRSSPGSLLVMKRFDFLPGPPSRASGLCSPEPLPSTLHLPPGGGLLGLLLQVGGGTLWEAWFKVSRFLSRMRYCE